MIADKSMPMFDPDNQWVDNKAIRTMMESFRLSPKTIGEMLYKLKDGSWRLAIDGVFADVSYKDREDASIPAYSTLVFDVMLAAYYRPGQLVPSWASENWMLWDE